MSKSSKKRIRWSKSSYMLLSGFFTLLFIIGYVWWPLLDDYLNQFDPEISVWLQVDWLLIGIFLVMSVLIMINADLKRDLPFAMIALAGGYIIEAWGSLSGLWTYYTFETPPLWIIPAWPIAALSVNRLYIFAKHLFKNCPELWFTALYWPIFGVFYFRLWHFAWPGIAHPLTWFALSFSGFIISTEKDKRSSLLIFMMGSALGYFLERWGTSRLCWTYYVGGMPPLITVFSHGMASIAVWRVFQIYVMLLKRSRLAQVAKILPSDQ